MTLSYGAYTNARLHDLRKSQGELAAALGYNRSYLSRAINGDQSPFATARARIDAQLDAWETEKEQEETTNE